MKPAPLWTILLCITAAGCAKTGGAATAAPSAGVEGGDEAALHRERRALDENAARLEALGVRVEEADGQAAASPPDAAAAAEGRSAESAPSGDAIESAPSADAEPAPAAPPSTPAASRARRKPRRSPTDQPDGAQQVCHLAQVACGLRDRICHLAQDHLDDPRYENACLRARHQCTHASLACDARNGG